MKSLTYRERFPATLNHQPVDRVPFDLAGTSLTGIEHPETIRKLQQYLGLSPDYDGWYRKFDERILEYPDINIRFPAKT